MKTPNYHRVRCILCQRYFGAKTMKGALDRFANHPKHECTRSYR